MAYVSLIGLVNDNYTENHTLRVRILHIHGLPDNAIDNNSNNNNRTKDEDLPIIPQEISPLVDESDYGPGALVRIECPTGILSSARVSKVVRTAQDMALYKGSLTSLLKSIPNDEIIINSNDSATYTEQTTVVGSPNYGANRYIPEYQTFFGYPFDTYYPMSSKYGIRTLYNSQTQRVETSFHPGVDFDVSQGTPIYSVADGCVISIFSNWTSSCGYSGMKSYGNFVTIDHGICPFDGIHYYTHYAHMQAVCVKVGDTVNGTQDGHEGTQIGTVGWSGRCEPNNVNGSHLHFEILTDVTWHNENTTCNPTEKVKII